MNTTELTKEHLSPYIPYGLNLLDSKNYHWKLTGTNMDFGIASKWKPILRSMKDIDEIISVNGELHFCAQDEFTEDQLKRYNELPMGCMNTVLDILSYYSITELIKWHYDVFGLIEKGLAVELKTMSES